MTPGCSIVFINAYSWRNRAISEGLGFSVFSSLFYFDNRKKYRLESGKTDTGKLKHDLKKLITSLGIAEVVYTVVRWALQYYFLTINYDPYLASIASQAISTIIYMIVLNLTVKITRLYKDGN